MAVRPNQRIIMLNKGIGNKGFTVCCDCGAAMPGDDPVVLKDVMRPYALQRGSGRTIPQIGPGVISQNCCGINDLNS